MLKKPEEKRNYSFKTSLESSSQKGGDKKARGKKRG